MVAQTIADDPIRDPGSFRDPAGGVFHFEGRILRYLSASGASDFTALDNSGLLGELIDRGDLIPTRQLQRSEAPTLQSFDADTVVEHERVPFISYAYEWPFELLRGAALQYLEALRLSLSYGFILKDATTFNTQFLGSRPVMIDVSSFEPYQPGQPWAGYAQFCRMFLNPLLLQSKAGIPFQQSLRSSIEGIAPSELSRLMPLRHKLRKSVFMHVVLQAWLGRKLERDQQAIKRAADQQVDARTLERLVDHLDGTIRGLRRSTNSSVWSEYEADCHYESDATAAKERFVDQTLAKWKPRSLWDFGCNRGQYSEIAARHSGYVVAMDGDELAVGAVTSRPEADHRRILPLVMDLGNPSPSQGWAGTERYGLTERGPADAALALALVHHLSLSGHVPLGAVVDWLADHARRAIVEFVPANDPMAQRLLAARLDRPVGYDAETFESALRRHFRIERVESLSGSGRKLYAVTRT